MVPVAKIRSTGGFGMRNPFVIYTGSEVRILTTVNIHRSWKSEPVGDMNLWLRMTDVGKPYDDGESESQNRQRVRAPRRIWS